MASVARSYTFTDGTDAYGSQVENELNTIFNAWNNHNAGTSTWTVLSASNASAVPLIANNSTGTNDIFNGRDNGTNIFRLVDGGWMHFRLQRQDNTTNNTDTNDRIQMGWGFITSDGSANDMTESISFASAYGAAPIVFLTTLGVRTGSDPADITELTGSESRSHIVHAEDVTANGFTVRMQAPDAADGNFTNTVRYGYAWLAIGAMA